MFDTSTDQDTIGPLPLVLLVISVLLAGSASCAAEAPSPEGKFNPVVTLRDLMSALIGPAADTLWASVTIVETTGGFEEQGPATDEEWEKLRRSAVTMVESANLMLIEGRIVARAGTGARTPGIQLEPDQIASLLVQDAETWTRLVHEFQQAGQTFLNAIDAKDPAPLLDAGDKLNAACGNCHEIFWYPSDPAGPSGDSLLIPE